MTQKFYVTLTWHDWPEGGSYGTVVEAKDYDEAEELARAEMRETYREEIDGDLDDDDDDYLDDWDANWHLVDCFKVADFHKHNEALKLLDHLLDSDDVIIDSAAADIIEQVKTLLV